MNLSKYEVAIETIIVHSGGLYNRDLDTLKELLEMTKKLERVIEKGYEEAHRKDE